MEKINDIYVYRHSLESTFNQSYLFISDVHYDSIYCNRVLLKKVFDKAKSIDARIFIFGDLFDAMGGKYDPRTAKEEIRPEYSRGGYFKQIIDDCSDFLTPYKDNIDLITDGNHELAVYKRFEFPLIDFTIGNLDMRIFHGRYDGFIRYMFGQGEDGKEGKRSSKLMYYTHGTGGHAEVTRGTIQTARRQVSIMADMFVSGHKHTATDTPLPQVRVSQANIIEDIEVEHWQLGTFKTLGNSDWERQKGFSKPNPGGRFLHYFHESASPGRVAYKSEWAK